MNRITIQWPEPPAYYARIRAAVRIAGWCLVDPRQMHFAHTDTTMTLSWAKPSPVASAPQADATQSEEA